MVGVGLTTVLPTGRYPKDRLLNLGSDRATVRPHFGIVHNHGPWSWEWNLGLYLSSDNDSFYQGNTLEQDPLFATQGRVVYSFRPGVWCGVGAAFGTAGRTSVNDRPSTDSENNFLWRASVGVPLSWPFGVKLTYIRTNSLERTGFDFLTFFWGVGDVVREPWVQVHSQSDWMNSAEPSRSHASSWAGSLSC